MKSNHFYFRHSLLSLLSFLEASLQLIKKCHANDSFGCLSFQNFKVNIKLLFVIVRKWLFNLWMKKKTKDWLSFIDISLCKFFIKNKSKPRTDELKGQNTGSSDLQIFDLNNVWCDFEDIIYLFIFIQEKNVNKRFGNVNLHFKQHEMRTVSCLLLLTVRTMYNNVS